MVLNAVTQLNHTILEAFDGLQIQGHVAVTSRYQWNAIPNKHWGHTAGKRDGARPAILQFYDLQSGQTALNVIRFHSDCTGRIAELQAWHHLLHRVYCNDL
jgi:hypothetical protein